MLVPMGMVINSGYAPICQYVNQGGITLEVTIPDRLTPFADYNMMINFTDNNNGTKTWRGVYEKDELKFFAFYAGDYIVESFTAAGTDIDFAYGRRYEKVIRDYDIIRAIATVFEYATEHYGPTSYIDGERLLLLLKSNMAGGGWAGEGYSEMFDSMLSPETLNNTVTGSDGFENSVHEMLHQWWGGLGLHINRDGLWSEEGMTVYSTYRVIKELYGELYAKEKFVDKWEAAVDAQNREFYYRHPEYLEKLPGKYQGGLISRNSGVNLYFRMPLMIYKAQQLVGGEEKMDEILKNIYGNREMYSYHQNPFTYQNFLEACGLKEEDLKLE
jgi:hypothetical protein